MKKVLVLGCGNRKLKDFINIDISKECGADVCCNIEEGLNYKDNSIDYIYSAHCLEHIHQEKFDFVLSEIVRVCKNNAKVKFYLPYFSNILFYRTLTHYTPITYNTFNHIKEFQNKKIKFYFFRESFEYVENKKLNYIKKIDVLFSFLPNKFPNVYERLFCWILPMEEIKFEFVVKK